MLLSFLPWLLIGCGQATRPAVTLATPRSDFTPAIVRAEHTDADEAKSIDTREWTELADALCKDAGGVEYGNDVSFSLARDGFFDAKDARLHEKTTAWLSQVAVTFAKLPRGASLVVSTTFEDDAASLAPAMKIALANQRAVALRDALVRAGISPARFTVHTTTTAWEGDYDGPATLDPAEGRVGFAVTR